MNLETAKYQTIEVIESEADLDTAIGDFFRWCNEQGGGPGLRHMIEFLQETRERGEAFRPTLLKRMYGELVRMPEACQKIDPNYGKAAAYVAQVILDEDFEAFHTREFHFFMEFYYRFPILERFPNLQNRQIGAAKGFSGYLDSLSGVSDSVLGKFQGDPPSPASWRLDIEHPMTNILRNYYNIPWFATGRPFDGHGEGAPISNTIYDYLFSEKARGRLSNLLPPAGPLQIDLRRFDWLHDPKNQHWVMHGVQEITEDFTMIPHEFLVKGVT